MSPAGRPEIGAPINIRLGDELLAAVDEYADESAIARAEAVRLLVQSGLSNKLDHIREFCNSIPEHDPAYELACDIRDFIDGDTGELRV